MLNSQQPEIALVVAVSRNGVIGSEGKLPWRLRDDMALFKQVTMGHPVIMGRRTWESIGRPLVNRTNIVLSRHPVPATVSEPPPGVPQQEASHANSLEEALTLARQAPGSDRICIIGGGQVYLQTLDLANVIYYTRVDADVEGDTGFPYLSPDQWRVTEEQVFAADERNDYAFAFQKMVRTR